MRKPAYSEHALVQVTVLLSPEQLAAIDERRARHKERRSRSEVIRDLVQTALAASTHHPVAENGPDWEKVMTSAVEVVNI